MKRWIFIIASLVVLLGAAGYFAYRHYHRRELPANIILISIDTLRADHVGSYGYQRDTTPTLDRIAEEGVRFENVVSTTSWTTPAHMGIFTSQYDLVHGVLDYTCRLDDKRTTMAEALKKAGYTTAGFYSSLTMDPIYGFGQGFDEYTCCYSYSSYVEPFREKADVDNFNQLLTRANNAASDEDFNLEKLSFRDITSPTVHGKVTDWLDKHHNERFFLFVHYFDPHYDYIPPPPYNKMFDPDYKGEIDGKEFITNPEINPSMDRRDLYHIIALYDGEIRYTDHYVGMLVDKLESLDILDESLLIITSDHGEGFFEHGTKGHDYNLFDEVIMVPLIMRYKGHLPAGKVIKKQVRLIDIFPTAAALMGVKGSPEAMGEDLSPYMLGKEEMPELSALSQLELGQRSLFSLRTLEWKFLYNRRNKSATCYDIESDPRERDPVPWRRPLFYRAKERFKKKMENVNAVSRKLERSEEKPQAPLTDAQKQRLRDLGYLK